jgi:hypothetical protein
MLCIQPIQSIAPPSLLRLDRGQHYFSIVENTETPSRKLLYRWNVSQQPESSHFLDETVSSESTVYFATPIHPIYVILPHMVCAIFFSAIAFIL